jgi:hypothetical protein
MTLYNIDIVADWKTAADDHIKIVDVHLLHLSKNQSVFKFISGNIFKSIVDDIESAELKRKWI